MEQDAKEIPTWVGVYEAEVCKFLKNPYYNNKELIKAILNSNLTLEARIILISLVNEREEEKESSAKEKEEEKIDFFSLKMVNENLMNKGNRK